MARLDAFIERLAARGGGELLFQTARGVVLSVDGEQRVLVRQALSTPQIVGAFAEIVPAEMQAGFPRPGRTVFPYPSPTGTVEIEFEASGAEVRGVVRRRSRGRRGLPGHRSSPGGALRLRPGAGSCGTAGAASSRGHDPAPRGPRRGHAPAALGDGGPEGLRPPPHLGAPAGAARRWRHRADAGVRLPRRGAAHRHALGHRAGQEPGGVPGMRRHRLRPRHRRGSLPRERLRRPARHRRGDAADPLAGPHGRGHGDSRSPSSTCASSRRGSSSSPGPPARASRRRSPPWSTT